MNTHSIASGLIRALSSPNIGATDPNLEYRRLKDMARTYYLWMRDAEYRGRMFDDLLADAAGWRRDFLRTNRMKRQARKGI